MTKKIVIIGAGVSGLMAASELLSKNFEVTMLEARDRTGGRINTVTGGFTRPVDAGAEFVHGEQPVTMTLVKQARAKLVRLAGDHYRIADAASRQGDFFNDQWNDMLEQLQHLQSDMTMAAFLDRHFRGDQYQELYKSVKGFVEGYDAADLDKVSAQALKEEWMETDDVHQYHIDGGYGALVNDLEEKIKLAGGQIILSSPVQAIEWLPGSVKVVLLNSIVYNADKVIVTVPIGVLQKGDIRFNPPIQTHRDAFNKIGFGSVIKFLFEFNEAFWERLTGRRFKNMAFIFSDAAIPTWWSQLPDKTPILTGWLGGPAARDATENREGLFEKAIASLCYIFDCPNQLVKEQLKQWQIIDWGEDPYAWGAYAYAMVETPEARETITTPVADTLYFAGEAIYSGAAMGTVEAALVSGQQVAERIFKG